MSSRRKFQRKLGNRRYKKIFVIATEGAKTEPHYFSLFQRRGDIFVNIKCLPGDTRSSPEKVMARMKKYLIENDLRQEDEAWLVVDKDRWTEEQLQKLYLWSQSQKNMDWQ